MSACARAPRAGRAGLGLGLLVILPWLAACSRGPSSAPPAPLKVDAVLPVARTFHAQVVAYGTLAADMRAQRALSLPQAGEVTEVDVLAGQRVREGDALLTLATDPATRSAWLHAQTALHLAQRELAHTEQLHAGKLATNVQLDSARGAVADARAALAAAAALGGAAANVTLRAPVAGVVLTLQTRPGQRVAAGTTLLELAPAAAPVARLGVGPAAIDAVHVGDAVRVQPVYAAAGAQALKATVVSVGAAVDPQSHLVPVTARLDGNVELATGSALTASIATRTFQAWAVPRTALGDDAAGTFVYQVEHGKAVRVAVKVLAPVGTPIGVAGAVDPHAPVITLGSYEVAAGGAVSVSNAGSPTP